MDAARTMLASVEDALWAGGPPQPSVETQVVHEKKSGRCSSRTAVATVGRATSGLVCIGLVEMQGDEETKCAIPSVMGSPEIRSILGGLVGPANMVPDFTSKLEIANEPPPGYHEFP